MNYKLKVISSTVRPGRKGPLIANWIVEQVKLDSSFDVELLDLGEINLPMMNEAAHPRLQKYEHQHTKDWSAKIEEADAFVFVTAEYDYNYPAPLRNALEYLSNEWAYKAAGIVSYGGISAGTRAGNSLKADLSTFKMVPVAEGVNLALFTQYIKEDGSFVAPEQSNKAAAAMIKEIKRWIIGLRLIKEDKS